MQKSFSNLSSDRGLRDQKEQKKLAPYILKMLSPKRFTTQQLYSYGHIHTLVAQINKKMYVNISSSLLLPSK